MSDMTINNDNKKADTIPTVAQDRRRLFGALAITTATAVWHTPIINAVILPAHAQTSICVTDTTVGGPLAGHPSGAANCQAACEAEAISQNAQLCAVTETNTPSGIDCECDLDLP
jgi:hypothetical protein